MGKLLPDIVDPKNYKNRPGDLFGFFRTSPYLESSESPAKVESPSNEPLEKVM